MSGFGLQEAVERGQETFALQKTPYAGGPKLALRMTAKSRPQIRTTRLHVPSQSRPSWVLKYPRPQEWTLHARVRAPHYSADFQSKHSLPPCSRQGANGEGRGDQRVVFFHEGFGIGPGTVGPLCALQ